MTPGSWIGGGLFILAISAFLLWNQAKAPNERHLEVEAGLVGCETQAHRQGRRTVMVWHLRLDTFGEVRLKTDSDYDDRIEQLCAEKSRVEMVVQGVENFRVMGLWDAQQQEVVSERASRRSEMFNRLTGNIIYWGMGLLGLVAIVTGIRQKQ